MTVTPTADHALPEEQTRTFDALTSGDYSNFALMSALYKGEPTSVIAAVVPNDEDDNVDVIPLFVWITDDMFDHLTPPDLGV